MEEQAKEVRAIGFNITANLGGTRQIVLQDFVSSDMPLKAAHARIDFAMALADRQAAKAEIVELRKEHEELDRSLAQYEIDRAAVDREFDKAQASLDVQIETMVNDRKAFYQKGYDNHVATGRQGAYTPKGQTDQALKVQDAGIQQAKDQKAKNQAERDQAVQNLEASINARKTRRDVAAERIAELQAIIDGD